MSKAWSFAGIWNRTLAINPPRERTPRDYVWASELGGSYYDRYFKMKGRKPTTPPNLRSRRKFEGGNLTEWIVTQILDRATILEASQEYITYEGPLRVTGRADLRAGGKIMRLSEWDTEDLPETFGAMAEVMIDRLRERYPDGLEDVNLEIKSCSGIMFERYMKAPSPVHGLQAFHYAYNTKRPTMLVYVSRDDFRIAEWAILPGSKKWLSLYEDDLYEMKKMLTLKSKTVKASYKEPLLSWNKESGRFSKNWKVEYSNWLTDYGFKKPDHYAKPAQSCALKLSNIVKRIRDGKPVEGKVNVKTLEGCYEFYPEAEAIINLEKEKHVHNSVS